MPANIGKFCCEAFFILIFVNDRHIMIGLGNMNGLHNGNKSNLRCMHSLYISNSRDIVHYTDVEGLLN